MRNKFLLICALVFSIYSCGKSKTETNSSFATKAETKPQFDKSSFGVYKGVIVGSSGYIVFKINNGDNVVKGFLKIDGKEDCFNDERGIRCRQGYFKCLIYRKFFLHENQC